MQSRSSADTFVFALGPWRLAVIAVAILASTVKVAIALKTLGTNDVLAWESFLTTLRESGGIDLYYRREWFNHPPFMLHVLKLMGLLTSWTGLPFRFWIRVPAILADLGTLLLVWKIIQPAAQTQSLRALLLMAAAPASIMISGFHGNTDPAMMFFLMLSVYLVEKESPAWLAGSALGMSMNIKVVPLVFVPTLLLYQRRARRRVAYVLAAVAVFFLGSMPYLLQDPIFVGRRVFGYASFYGHWGISHLLQLTKRTPFHWLNDAYFDFGRLVVLGVILIASFCMNRRPKRPPPFLQCGLVSFLFMTCTPGFGVQYLAWLVPWVVALGVRATLMYYSTSGIFLFLVYTYWSRGFPWYLADAGIGFWRGSAALFEVLCWASVFWIFLVYVRRLCLQSDAAETTEATQPGGLSLSTPPLKTAP